MRFGAGLPCSGPGVALRKKFVASGAGAAENRAVDGRAGRFATGDGVAADRGARRGGGDAAHRAGGAGGGGGAAAGARPDSGPGLPAVPQEPHGRLRRAGGGRGEDAGGTEGGGAAGGGAGGDARGGAGG